MSEYYLDKGVLEKKKKDLVDLNARLRNMQSNTINLPPVLVVNELYKELVRKAIKLDDKERKKRLKLTSKEKNLPDTDKAKSIFGKVIAEIEYEKTNINDALDIDLENVSEEKKEEMKEWIKNDENYYFTKEGHYNALIHKITEYSIDLKSIYMKNITEEQIPLLLASKENSMGQIFWVSVLSNIYKIVSGIMCSCIASYLYKNFTNLDLRKSIVFLCVAFLLFCLGVFLDIVKSKRKKVDSTSSSNKDLNTKKNLSNKLLIWVFKITPWVFIVLSVIVLVVIIFIKMYNKNLM